MTSEIDRSSAVRPGEELDIAKLQQYLLDQLPEMSGELVVEQFPSGYSNLTYFLKLGEQELVLRRPPFGNKVKSAHDMGREYRVLSQLCKVYAPAPKPYLYCEDETIIGAPFYVMEKRTGIVLRKENTPEILLKNPEVVRGLCESVVDNLALLHGLDYEAAGLGDLGRPEGYIERQVQGWTKRYLNAKTDDWPEIEQIATWLADNQPASSKSALIHNDYKYDNLMLDPNDFKIVAVLDWEMTTIGDPLMDLGASLAYWVEENDPLLPQNTAFGPTMLPGSLTRKEVAQRYCQQTGTDVESLLFYYCYGLFKLAGIIQQIYYRYAQGHTQDARFKDLNLMVASLGRAAVAAVDQGDI